MSKHQRTVWAMSSTVSSAYNFAMQELTTRSYTSSEQHKELSTSRLRRDETDLGKVAEKLDSFTPFSTNESLHIFITGINANEDVNGNRKRHCTEDGRTVSFLKTFLLLSQTEFEGKDSSIEQERRSFCNVWG